MKEISVKLAEILYKYRGVLEICHDGKVIKRDYEEGLEDLYQVKNRRRLAN
ncbi:hypothetical protein [Dethiothermospora halolimnae]|uniref:hypothetical protein n=1 Tax=Dethiothermospora halolimnae TaxID=3114390 RepID=UPI003CCC32BC